MNQIVSTLRGIFKIGKVASNNLGDVLDAQAECCAGVHCCLQVLILKDQATKVRYVGYFLNGVWTTKTLAAFKAEGPDPVGP